MKLFDNPPQEQIIWRVRESGLGATARVLRRFRKLLDAFDYGCALYGHFGQGCVHTRIDFDFVTREGINHFRDFIITPPIWSLNSAGLFPASTATAKLGRSCCRRCFTQVDGSIPPIQNRMGS